MKMNENMRLSHTSRQGFALISTLAILVVVTILVVAFAVTMRTERTASRNFVDRDRAEAVALGILSRILAEAATPEVNGEPLKPFKVNDGVHEGDDDDDDTTVATAMPTEKTSKNYYAADEKDPLVGPLLTIPTKTEQEELLPIYKIPWYDSSGKIRSDADDILNETGLIRVSEAASGGGKDAYTADYWAYDGLTESVINSTDAQPEIVPQWVDYYGTDDGGTKMSYPTAQFAYAIWDEGGKIDINLAGEDDYINGIAPHNFEFEKLTANPSALTDYLNGKDGERERNNFALRRVSTETDPKNDRGDDRSFFSIRELYERGFLTGDQFRLFTTVSRDFDVRPEWDGDRAPLSIRKVQPDYNGSLLGAESFLRSYINNPMLYGLFLAAGTAGPFLVSDTLNENDLFKSRLLRAGNLSPRITDRTNPNTPPNADWMQAARLLAVLRRALPAYPGTAPYSSYITDGVIRYVSQSIPWGQLVYNEWSPFDVWGTALNLVQATDQTSDINLTGYDLSKYTVYPFNDPNVVVGVRPAPLITEVVLKVKKQTNGDFLLTNYVKIWNPYPFVPKNQTTGQTIQYRVSAWTGGGLPTTGDTVVSNDVGIAAGARYPDGIVSPDPGQFKVIKVAEATLYAGSLNKVGTPGSPATDAGFWLRLRPYIQDMNYPSGFQGLGSYPETVYYGLAMAPMAAPSGTSQYDGQLFVWMDKTKLQAMNPGGVWWYSFQIDDPRMASYPRLVTRPTASNVSTDGATWPTPADDKYRYSWIGYNNVIALPTNVVPVGNPSGTGETAAADPDIASASNNSKTFNVAGYNANFGINWPGANRTTGVPSGDMSTFNKMMATFAIPGRPLLTMGDLGTIYTFRPWTTLNFANKIWPAAMGGEESPDPKTQGDTDISRRPAAFLDYYTTVGTSTDAKNLQYFETSATSSGRPPSTFSSSVLSQQGQTNFKQRQQDKLWLFESVDANGPTDTMGFPTTLLTGNLRPIRGRVNLNTASTEVLTDILKAPYRMPASIGLQSLSPKEVSSTTGDPDYLVTISPSDAKAMAEAITLPISDTRSIRPLRMLSDLALLYDKNPNLMQQLYATYPQSVISAMIGRLAQFGTVRTQSYTIDLVVRTLNPEIEKTNGGASSDNSVITGEARLQARVFLDTFSRKAFVESLQYR